LTANIYYKNSYLQQFFEVRDGIFLYRAPLIRSWLISPRFNDDRLSQQVGISGLLMSMIAATSDPHSMADDTHRLTVPNESLWNT
jgi:hypothetical protein